MQLGSQRILALSAYRWTGKDTLVEALQSRKIRPFDCNDKEIKPFWLIYAPDSFPAEEILTFLSTKWTRLAFADALKEDVSQHFGLTNIRESDKDSFIIQGKSLRQHYIDYGAQKRAEDPDYWIKRAFYRLKASEGIIFPNIVITDMRFPNEAEYLNSQENVLTARLFRSAVPIPDFSMSSEHSLDKLKTDLLLVATTSDFHLALEIFPQYQGYQAKLVIE